ncbi:MAG: hypothetical protein ACE5J6_04415 [Candidatus Bathyarchaeia archaeon]
MSAKVRKAPSGEWLGYPTLSLEDIEHEAFKVAKHFALSLVENRKGRVCLLMDSDLYQKFLDAVRQKFGNISAANVEKAALEAVKAWIEGAKSK